MAAQTNRTQKREINETLVRAKALEARKFEYLDAVVKVHTTW